MLLKTAQHKPAMKRLQGLVRDLFGFSKTETNGFIVLLPLLLIIVLSPSLYRHFKTPSSALPTVQDFYLDSLISEWEANEQRAHESVSTEPISPFNPNTIAYAGLIEAGFPPHLALRIVNYRKKGGRFNAAADLLKIYGMDSTLYLKIRPLIQLPAQTQAKEQLSKKPKYKREVVVFDLNLADTSQLQSLHGIGSKLANRIIAYRQRLGGFVSQDQLTEVYGLDSTVIGLLKKASFIDPGFRPARLNINGATEQEMAQHPYIRYKLAKIIAAYRFQHGTFKEIDDLLSIEKMDPSIVNKIRPYVKVEP